MTENAKETVQESTNETTPEDTKPKKGLIDFLQIGVDVYNGYKISKDGLSREEDVEVMKGVFEDERARNVGWRALKRVLGGVEKENESDESEH